MLTPSLKLRPVQHEQILTSGSVTTAAHNFSNLTPANLGHEIQIKGLPSLQGSLIGTIRKMVTRAGDY